MFELLATEVEADFMSSLLQHNSDLIYKKKKTWRVHSDKSVTVHGCMVQNDQCTQQKRKRNFEGIKHDPSHIEEVHIQLKNDAAAAAAAVKE